MSLRTVAQYDLWTLSSAGDVTKMVYGRDFRNATISLFVKNGYNWDVKFFASNSESRPDLSSAASATNEYAQVQVVDKLDWASYSWVYTVSSNWWKRFEVNDNDVTWVWVEMDTETADWDIDVYVDFSDNQ